jgi:hypothetical protein
VQESLQDPLRRTRPTGATGDRSPPSWSGKCGALPCTVRLPLIVYQVGIDPFLAVQVAELADGLGKGNAASFLLKGSYISWIQSQILQGVVVKDIGFGRVKRGLDQSIELGVDQPVGALLPT